MLENDADLHRTGCCCRLGFGLRAAVPAREVAVALVLSARGEVGLAHGHEAVAVARAGSAVVHVVGALRVAVARVIGPKGKVLGAGVAACDQTSALPVAVRGVVQVRG